MKDFHMYKNNAFIFLMALGCYSTNVHSMKRTRIESNKAGRLSVLATTTIINQTTEENTPQEILPEQIPSSYDGLLEILLITKEFHPLPRDCHELLVNSICSPEALWDAFGTAENDFQDCDKRAIKARTNRLTLNYRKINSAGVEETSVDYLLGTYQSKYEKILTNTSSREIASDTTKSMAQNIADILDIILSHKR
jgi:hypothetical protein